MNVALIVAGGSGKRMGQAIPKQFINVEDKPILIYTMEAFQKHPNIDCILLVCIDGWQDIAMAYANQFHIDKLKWIITGGNTVQESIRNGVFFLEDKVDDNDTIIIHDGVRPLIKSEILSDVIEKSQKYGNAVSSTVYNEQMFIVSNDEVSTDEYIPREKLRKVSTPQAYRYNLLRDKYYEAFEKGIGISESSYTNTMMADLGVTLFLASGSDNNLKLTTTENLEMFKAYLKSNQ